jgi:hypothetical protein
LLFVAGIVHAQAIDGLRRRIGMERGEDHVAGFRGLESSEDAFLVANFADENYVLRMAFRTVRMVVADRMDIPK